MARAKWLFSMLELLKSRPRGPHLALGKEMAADLRVGGKPPPSAACPGQTRGCLRRRGWATRDERVRIRRQRKRSGVDWRQLTPSKVVFLREDLRWREGSRGRDQSADWRRARR